MEAVIEVARLVAVATSIGLTISVWPVLQAIVRAGTTKPYKFAPFWAMATNNTIGGLYGILIGNQTLFFTKGFNLMIDIYYIVRYWQFRTPADGKEGAAMVATTMLILGICAVMLTMVVPEGSRIQCLGLCASGTSTFLSVSPLLNIREVIRRKDASEIPVGLTVVSLVNAASWVIYALSLHNTFVVTQNVVAVVMAAISALLLIWYPRKEPTSTAMHV